MNKIEELEKRVEALEKQMHQLKAGKKSAKKRTIINNPKAEFSFEASEGRKLFNHLFDIYQKQGVEEFEHEFQKLEMVQLLEMNKSIGFAARPSSSKKRIKENLLNKINQKKQLMGG